jgi:hypothetical protein
MYSTCQLRTSAGLSHRIVMVLSADIKYRKMFHHFTCFSIPHITIVTQYMYKVSDAVVKYLISFSFFGGVGGYVALYNASWQTKFVRSWMVGTRTIFYSMSRGFDSYLICKGAYFQVHQSQPFYEWIALSEEEEEEKGLFIFCLEIQLICSKD